MALMFPSRKEQFQEGGNSLVVIILLNGEVCRLSSEKCPGAFYSALFIHLKNIYWESLKCQELCQALEIKWQVPKW